MLARSRAAGSRAAATPALLASLIASITGSNASRGVSRPEAKMSSRRLACLKFCFAPARNMRFNSGEVDVRQFSAACRAPWWCAP